MAALLVIATAAWFHARKLTQKAALSYQETAFNRAVLSRMPTLRKPLQPLAFLTNGHAETIFAAFFRRRVDLHYRREYLLVPEGGVVALDWRISQPGDVVRA